MFLAPVGATVMRIPQQTWLESALVIEVSFFALLLVHGVNVPL